MCLSKEGGVFFTLYSQRLSSIFLNHTLEPEIRGTMGQIVEHASNLTFKAAIF